MEPRKFRGSTSSPGHRSKAAAGSAATAGWIECAARLEVVSPLTKMPWPLIGEGASRHPHGRGADCRRGLSRRKCAPAAARSEEHTSELQALMRISHAVFRLPK